jgi:hypothetical protein
MKIYHEVQTLLVGDRQIYRHSKTDLVSLLLFLESRLKSGVVGCSLTAMKQLSGINV